MSTKDSSGKEEKQPQSPDGAKDAAEAALTDNLSRRDFVKTTAAAAVVLTGVGGVGVLTGGKEMLRPPGGQNEERFIAKCNRCERCVSICHTNAISIATLSDGLVNARTPIMKFSLGECDFCGDCAKVCPTGALQMFDIAAAKAGDVSAVRIGIAELDPSICLSYISDSCNLCFTHCPYQAIELNVNGNPLVVENPCNGCGVCENVCPVLSLRSYIGGNIRAITVVPAKQAAKEIGVSNG